MQLDRKRSFVGIAIIIVALLAGGSYFKQVHDEQDRATCQAQYNAAFAQNLQIRSELSGARQDAEDNLLTTVASLVLHPAVTAADKARESQDFIHAFQTYEDATAAYNAQKDHNPLPPLPSC